MAKKKRGKNLLLLSLVLVLLLGATVIATKLNPEHTEAEGETVNEGMEIFTVDEAATTNISWTVNGEELSFSKADDIWLSDHDADFPVDQSYLETIFTNLNGLLAYSTIENVNDLSEYGLDEPTVTIELSGDSSAQLLLGDAAPMDSLRYLSLGDGNVYLVSNSILYDFNYSIDDLLDMEEIPSLSNHLSISVKSADSELLLTCSTNTVNEEKVSVWTCGEQELDASLVQSFCENITGINWLSCVNYKADEAALAEYGLTEPQLTASITYAANTSEETFTLEVGAQADESSCYARIAGSSMVYTMDSAVLETLTTTTAEDLVATESAE